MSPSQQHSRRRACASCVRAKVKCCAAEEAGTCDRCSRLKQPCSLPGLPGQAERIGVTKKDKLDRIQEQLDALIAQISEKKEEKQLAKPEIPDSPCHQLQVSDEFRRGDIFVRGVITVSRGAELLEKFRTHKMALFPFVVVPPEIDLATLRQQSPFLLLTILGACQDDNQQLQRQLDLEANNEVARRIVVQAERNMDLLMGLLVYVAWHQIHWQRLHPQMIMLLQMARTLVADMGLDGEASYVMPSGYSVESRVETTLLPAAYQQSAAAKRAVLGCYYLCSMLSIFRQGTAMRLTPQMVGHCESLFSNPEHQTDILMRVFIDCQSLCREIEDKRSQNDTLAWDSLSPKVAEVCRSLRAQLGTHGLYVNGASLIEFKAIQAFVGIRYLRHLKKRFEPSDFMSVQATVMSAKAAITSFLELPGIVVIHLPITSLVTVWYCLLILCKLAVLAPRDLWVDKDEVGRSQSRQLVLAVVHKVGPLFPHGECWKVYGRVIGSLLPWLEERMADDTPIACSVTLPRPIDDVRIAEATRLSYMEHSHGGRALTSGPASPGFGIDSVTPSTTDVQQAPAPVAGNGGQAGAVNENGFFWDDAAWQQMLVDFAVNPAFVPGW